ncbi:hypothetical protein HZH66_010311 [Vespula vulgaris]|uniref:Uncharacterized protein n=1 Tax=Vespula vulgaris TaxID=7454 RepID=A0A834JLK1_VESVU|nr:hypothetical protein HZH66_010311 [Vespula vulgaris]
MYKRGFHSSINFVVSVTGRVNLSVHINPVITSGHCNRIRRASSLACLDEKQEEEEEKEENEIEEEEIATEYRQVRTSRILKKKEKKGTTKKKILDHKDPFLMKMSDETFAKTLIGDIPYADDDGYTIEQIPRSRLVSRISTNEKGNVRNSQISSRNSRTIIYDKRENTRNDNNRTTNQKYIYTEKKDNDHRLIGKRIDKFQNPLKSRSKQSPPTPIPSTLPPPPPPPSPPLQQQQQQQPQQPQQPQQIQQQSGYSSSEESIVRNKSKSTSSADTQSVNNILDEYEDERMIESSDVGSTCTMNIIKSRNVEHQKNKKEIQQPQQYHNNNHNNDRSIHHHHHHHHHHHRQQQQQQQIIKRTTISSENNFTSSRRNEKDETITKINRQAQGRQRSRDRVKDPTRYSSSALTSSSSSRRASPLIIDNIDRTNSVTMMSSSSSRTNEDDLPRKGEVQRRVDEWLNQAQLQSSINKRDKPLTRSNSTAERRTTQRRCRQDPRSRSIDESTDRANNGGPSGAAGVSVAGGSTSSYDDLTRTNKESSEPSSMTNILFNKGTYKDYLLIKNKSRQQDYGFLASNGVNRRDISPNTSTSRIPQRGSSFKRTTIEPKDNKLSNSNYTDNNGLSSVSVLSRKSSFKRSYLNEYHIDRNNVATSVGVSSLMKNNDEDNNGVRSIIDDERSSKRIDEDWIVKIKKDGEKVRLDCSVKKDETFDETLPNVVHSKSNHVVVGKRDNITRNDCEDKGNLVSVQVRLPSSQGQIDWRKLNPRKAPILPRKDSGSHLRNQCNITFNEAATTRSSTFKPNDRNCVKSVKLLKKDNTCDNVKYIFSSSSSSSSSLVSSSNHVEKIYERTLEPQVIYADDLRSILRPSLRISAYGERTDTCELEEENLRKRQKEGRKEEEEEAEEEEEEKEEGEEERGGGGGGGERGGEIEEEIYSRIGETRQETLETIMEDDRKVEIVRCNKGSVTLDDWKTIDQINSINSDEKSLDTMMYHRFSSNTKVDNNKMEDEDMKNDLIEMDEGNYDLDDRLLIMNTEKVFSIDNNEDDCLMNKFKEEEEEEDDTQDVRSMIENDMSILSSKENNEDRSSVMVVKESLLKNLQFDAGLPAKVERRSESKCGDQQANRSKRFDDRVELVERDEGKGEEEKKKTREEMEHSRLMDLLRNGDYEAVKLK